jgi:trimethylamine:corrinoid methyltransferase-like protein
MLNEYQPPEIDPAIDAGLRDYIATRMAALPDSDY